MNEKDSEQIPDASSENEVLSESEVQALLEHSGPQGTGPFSSPAVVRALLVSRQDEDLSLLTRLLARDGVEMSITRNPFTALDYLRARDYHGVFAEFSIWGSKGSLLFQRISKLDRQVPVVFICERGTPDFEAASLSGAVAVLERPLDSAEVAKVVRDLFSRSSPKSPRARTVQESLAAIGPSVGPENTTVDQESGRGPEPEGQGIGGPSREQEWYRFFFEARRAVRALPGTEGRLRIVVDLFLEIMKAEAVAVFCSPSRRGDPRSFSSEIRVAESSRGQEGRVSGEALQRIFQLLSQIPPDEFESGTLRGFQRQGALKVCWKNHEDLLRILIAVDPEETPALPCSPRILEELQFLLRHLE